MRLTDIKIEDVIAGKNWTAEFGEDGTNPLAMEAVDFGPTDSGLFSSVIKFGDGSVHAGLVVKSFERGGDDVDLFVLTKFGWLNLHANGFMRAVGKYSHEIFPFEYYLANPWKGGPKPAPESDSPHRAIFAELVGKVVTPQQTGTRRRML